MMARGEHAVDADPDREQVPQVDRLRACDGLDRLPSNLHAEWIKEQDRAMLAPVVVPATVDEKLVAFTVDDFDSIRLLRPIESEVIQLVTPVRMELNEQVFHEWGIDIESDSS